MCHPVISTQATLSERLMQSTIGTLELYGVFLGTELGLYRAPRLFEQMVIPDGSSGIHAFFHIAPFQHVLLVGVIPPHAGVTIGL